MQPGGGRRPGWIAFLLFFALVLTPVLVVAQAPSVALADDDITTVLRKIQELDRAAALARQSASRYAAASQQYQAAVAAANVRIADLAAQERDAKDEVEQTTAQIAIAEEQLSLVTLQLDEAVAYVNSLIASIDEGTKLLGQRETLYGQHLRQLYRQYRVTPLEMLLSSSSLADFAQRVQLLMLVTREDQQLAASIKDLRASNEEKKITAELEQAEVQGLRDQLTRSREDLLAEKARLDDLIARTEASRAQTEAYKQQSAANQANAAYVAKLSAQQAANLEAQKLQAEALYAQLAGSLQGASGLTRPWVGKLTTWPLIGPLTSYFGPRWGGFHNGIDIAAPMYTPIRAASAGLVQVVGHPYIAYGDTAMEIIIAHASNMSTLYAHLDDRVRPPIVRPGQWVVAGQIIGYVGMTGWTTGPHLHFMTVYKGRAVDPLPYLP